MRAVTIACALALAGACKASGDGAPDASASPQASAEPAPLAAAPQATPIASAAPSAPEAGPPPVPLRSDERLAGDSYVRETAGYALSALFRPADVVLPPRAPEVNVPEEFVSAGKFMLSCEPDVQAIYTKIWTDLLK